MRLRVFYAWALSIALTIFLIVTVEEYEAFDNHVIKRINIDEAVARWSESIQMPTGNLPRARSAPEPSRVQLRPLQIPAGRWVENMPIKVNERARLLNVKSGRTTVTFHDPHGGTVCYQQTGGYYWKVWSTDGEASVRVTTQRKSGRSTWNSVQSNIGITRCLR